MTRSHWWLGLAMLGMVAAPARGAHGPGFPLEREDAYLHVCSGGSNAGEECFICGESPCTTIDPDACPGGTCTLVIGPKVNATLTLVADDDVRDFSGAGLPTSNVVAVTVLLATRRGLFATIRQGLDPTDLIGSLATGPTLDAPDNVNVPINEVDLFTVATMEGPALLFQADDELSAVLKVAYGVTDQSIPVVTKLGRAEGHSQHPNNPAASVLQRKLQLRFLTPRP